MSRRQKVFAFIGAFMGVIYLSRDVFGLPEFFACFCMGAAFGVLVLNLFLTDERAAKLCAWKRRVLARLVGRG